MPWNEQQKINKTKIIESAKLIEQLITIFSYPKGIQDVGDFVSSVEHKEDF